MCHSTNSLDCRYLVNLLVCCCCCCCCLYNSVLIGPKYRESGNFRIFVLGVKKRGKRTYECNECKQVFENNMQLNKHKQTHNNKEYSCEVCDCKFNSSKCYCCCCCCCYCCDNYSRKFSDETQNLSFNRETIYV